MHTLAIMLKARVKTDCPQNIVFVRPSLRSLFHPSTTGLFVRHSNLFVRSFRPSFFSFAYDRPHLSTSIYKSTRPSKRSILLFSGVESNEKAKQLYKDILIHNNYNKLIRPVGNNTDKLTVKLGLRLSQLIDVVSCIPHITHTPSVTYFSSRSAYLWTPSRIHICTSSSSISGTADQNLAV